MSGYTTPVERVSRPFEPEQVSTRLRAFRENPESTGGILIDYSRQYGPGNYFQDFEEGPSYDLGRLDLSEHHSEREMVFNRNVGLEDLDPNLVTPNMNAPLLAGLDIADPVDLMDSFEPIEHMDALDGRQFVVSEDTSKKDCPEFGYHGVETKLAKVDTSPRSMPAFHNMSVSASTKGGSESQLSLSSSKFSPLQDVSKLLQPKRAYQPDEPTSTLSATRTRGSGSTRQPSPIRVSKVVQSEPIRNFWVAESAPSTTVESLPSPAAVEGSAPYASPTLAARAVPTAVSIFSAGATKAGELAIRSRNSKSQKFYGWRLVDGRRRTTPAKMRRVFSSVNFRYTSARAVGFAFLNEKSGRKNLTRPRVSFRDAEELASQKSKPIPVPGATQKPKRRRKSGRKGKLERHLDVNLVRKLEEIFMAEAGEIDWPCKRLERLLSELYEDLELEDLTKFAFETSRPGQFNIPREYLELRVRHSPSLLEYNAEILNELFTLDTHEVEGLGIFHQETLIHLRENRITLIPRSSQELGSLGIWFENRLTRVSIPRIPKKFIGLDNPNKNESIESNAIVLFREGEFAVAKPLNYSESVLRDSFFCPVPWSSVSATADLYLFSYESSMPLRYNRCNPDLMPSAPTGVYEASGRDQMSVTGILKFNQGRASEPWIVSDVPGTPSNQNRKRFRQALSSPSKKLLPVDLAFGESPSATFIPAAPTPIITTKLSTYTIPGHSEVEVISTLPPIEIAPKAYSPAVATITVVGILLCVLIALYPALFLLYRFRNLQRNKGFNSVQAL